MKRIFCSIAAIAVCFLCLDRSLSCLLGIIYEKSNCSEDVRIKQVAREVDADFITMGASRTCRHYVPSILEDSLHVTAFNAGVDNSGDIFFQYALLNLLLEHHTPKAICMEVGRPLFDGTSENIAQLAPYIGHNAEVDKVFKDLGLYTGYAISHTYRYNTCIIPNVLGLLTPMPNSSLKGYDPLPRPKTPLVMTSEDSVSTLNHSIRLNCDDLAMSYVGKFIGLCDSLDIALIFCAPPSCGAICQDMYDLTRDIASRHDILFLDYHTSGFMQDDKSLWKDYTHMCGEGAELFTAEFCKDVILHGRQRMKYSTFLHTFLCLERKNER